MHISLNERLLLKSHIFWATFYLYIFMTNRSENLYVHIYMYTCIHIYIYIYTGSPRSRYHITSLAKIYLSHVTTKGWPSLPRWGSFWGFSYTTYWGELLGLFLGRIGGKFWDFSQDIFTRRARSKESCAGFQAFSRERIGIDWGKRKFKTIIS